MNIPNRISFFTSVLIVLIISLNSCLEKNKDICQVTVSDSTIAEVINDLILGDTLPVTDSLSKLLSKTDRFRYLCFIKPKFNKFTKYISLDRADNGLSYFSNVNPNFTKQDSLDIFCQIKSDTIDKYLKHDLIKVKNLKIMDMKIVSALTLDSLYKVYRQFYTFSTPYFFSSGSKCIVDVRFRCGPLCGTFWLYLMEKSNDKWIIIRKAYYGCS